MLLNKLKRYFSFYTLKRVGAEAKYYVVGLYHRIDEHHLFLSAGGVAFSLFASMIPFSLIAFSILGNLLDNEAVQEQLSLLLNTIIPYPEYANYTYRVIMSRVPEVIEYKTIAAYVGVLGLLFISSGIFSSLRTVLNRIFHVSEQKNLFIGKLRDFGMVILLIVFLLFQIFILPALNFITSKAYESELLKIFRLGAFIDILISVGSVLIILGMFFIFYNLIPYAKLGRSVPFVAAVSATFLWEIARQIFGYYLSNIATLNKIYGTYALVVVVAFWIYYSSILFLIGAEIGQLYRERRAQSDLPSYEKT